MPLRIRPALAADHAAVADLTASVYRGEGFSSADYEPALRDVTSRAASATVLVAVDDADRPGHGAPPADMHIFTYMCEQMYV